MDLNTIYFSSKDLTKDYNNYSNKKDFKNDTYEEFVVKMEIKYEYLKTNCNSIFLQCIEGKMDLDILSYMINQAKNLEKNKISNHIADVNVGQKLVDKLIKPNLKKKE